MLSSSGPDRAIPAESGLFSVNDRQPMKVSGFTMTQMQHACGGPRYLRGERWAVHRDQSRPGRGRCSIVPT
jgi:hypothetical protein